MLTELHERVGKHDDFSARFQAERDEILAHFRTAYLETLVLDPDLIDADFVEDAKKAAVDCLVVHGYFAFTKVKESNFSGI